MDSWKESHKVICSSEFIEKHDLNYMINFLKEKKDNYPILILDDALSAVDTDTEEHILQNLKKNRAGKTTILIAHRISTVQNADIIMVLEDGEAKEIGNHESLMKENGIYRDMFEKQQLEAEGGAQ